MQNRIERYIRGQLTPEQIDELWIEFIQDPELYEFFLTELHLTTLIQSQNIPFREQKIEGVKSLRL